MDICMITDDKHFRLPNKEDLLRVIKKKPKQYKDVKTLAIGIRVLKSNSINYERKDKILPSTRKAITEAKANISTKSLMTRFNMSRYMVTNIRNGC